MAYLRLIEFFEKFDRCLIEILHNMFKVNEILILIERNVNT